MGAFIDLTGQKFGRLTVVKRIENKGKSTMWECLCTCGNVTNVSAGNLRKGHTQSCGCLWNDSVPGSNKFDCIYDSSSRLYKIWTHMKERCLKPYSNDYKHYGARGISICGEWENSFEDFADWAIQNGYNDSLTIDRIDVNGNYTPENCRWVNMKVQENNKTDNRVLEFRGVSKTMSQWSDYTGISVATIYARLNKLGWSVEKALTTPVKKSKRSK